MSSFIREQIEKLNEERPGTVEIVYDGPKGRQYRFQGEDHRGLTKEVIINESEIAFRSEMGLFGENSGGGITFLPGTPTFEAMQPQVVSLDSQSGKDVLMEAKIDAVWMGADQLLSGHPNHNYVISAMRLPEAQRRQYVAERLASDQGIDLNVGSGE